jgi:hypothetical protein
MISSLALLGAQQVAAAGTVTHYSISFIQTSFTVGMPNNLIIKAVDDTETQVSGFNSAVNLTCSDPYAILPTNRTLLINNGIGGGLTLHFGTAGTQTITVTDTTDNTLVGTLTITVAPIHYAISVTPTNITAGESVNVTVAALNETDGVLTELGNSGYGGSILFSSTDSLAVFPAQGSPSNLLNGNRTFTVTLNTTGSQTITVVNQAFPLVNATTTTITVNAPAAQATATPTPTAAPTQTITPSTQPTTQPTQAPTATPIPQVTNTSNDNLVLIVIIIIIVVVVVLVAVLFLRKKRGISSDLPPPPPPPT